MAWCGPFISLDFELDMALKHVLAFFFNSRKKIIYSHGCAYIFLLSLDFLSPFPSLLGMYVLYLDTYLAS